MNTAFRSRRELSRLGGLLLVLLIFGTGYTRAQTQDQPVVVGAAGLASGSPAQVDFGEVVYGGRKQAYVTVVNQSRDSLTLHIPWLARWSGGLQAAVTSVPPGARRTVRFVFKPNLLTLLLAPRDVPVRYASSTQPLVVLSGKAAFPPVSTASLVDFAKSFAAPWDKYLGYRIAAVITVLGLLALLLWVGIPAVTDRLRALRARAPRRSSSPSRAAARFVQHLRSRRERPAPPAGAGQPAPGPASTAPRPEEEKKAVEQWPAFQAPSLRADDIAEPAAPHPPAPEQPEEAADVPTDPVPGAVARAEAEQAVEGTVGSDAGSYAAEQQAVKEAGFASAENGRCDEEAVAEHRPATAEKSVPGKGQPVVSEPERRIAQRKQREALQKRAAAPAKEDAAGRATEKPTRRGWRKRPVEQDPFSKVVATVHRHLGRMKALRQKLASTPRAGSLQDAIASLRTRRLFASVIRSLTRHMRKHDVVKIENFQVLWILKTVLQQMERTQAGAIEALDEAQQQTARWLAAQHTDEPEALSSAEHQTSAAPRPASRALPVR